MINDTTPPAPATASAAMRLRMERANTLAIAIADAHPDDAHQIMTAALDDMQTIGPMTSSFGPIRDDAQWWAEICPQHELQEYVYAGLKVLAGRALGRSARLKFLAALWNGVAPNDKQEFIDRVARQ